MRRTGRAAAIVTALVVLVSGAPVWAEGAGEGDAGATSTESAPPEEQSEPDEQTAPPADDAADAPQESEGAAPDEQIEAPVVGDPAQEAAPVEAASAEAPPAPEAPAAGPVEPAVAVAATATEVSGVAGTVATTTQATSITSSAVAVATSGGNLVIASGGDGGSSQPAIVGTGNANAQGSVDSTSVVQEADAVLSGEATADITQIVLVFNIGAALANSGLNVIGGAGSDGSLISTGSSTAIGNQSASYHTQAADADAGAGETNTTNQLALNLRLGVAVSESGANSIVVSGPGGTSTGGVIDTGSATATGNQSITEIVQRALATGSGSAHLSIQQRAIVVNLGLALANSGVNTVRGIAGNLLDAPDEFIARELFALILPALLASANAGDGTGAGGAIVSGNATAIGNQSRTYVDQTAIATAAGDGTASISQELVVANVGAAVANTGGNQLGSADGAPAELDDEGRRVAGQLGDFLTQLLEEIERWSMVPGASPLDLGLSLPIGDLLIGLNASIGGNVMTVSDTGADARARVRQVTAIVSIGISRANTGFNATSIVVGTGDDLTALRTSVAAAAIGAGGSATITTGDTSAINSSLVIICQREDSPDHPCLGPPVPPVPPVDPVTPVVPAVTPGRPTTPLGVLSPAAQRPAGAISAAQDLPATGVDAQLLLVIGAALVVTGGLLTRVRRRPVT